MQRRIWMITAVLLAGLVAAPALTVAHDRHRHRDHHDDDRVVIRYGDRDHVRHWDEEDWEDFAEAMRSLEIYFDEEFSVQLEEALDDALEVLDDPRFENSIERAIEDAMHVFESDRFERDLERSLEEAMRGFDGKRFERDLERSLAEALRGLEHLDLDWDHGRDRHWRQLDRRFDRDDDRKEALERRLEALQDEMERLERRLERMDAREQTDREG